MIVQAHQSSSHAVFSLKLHIVFVAKYRRKLITPAMHEFLGQAFAEILKDWRCELLEFGSELDHVHLLVDIHPALNISVLINNLKTASARRAGSVFADRIAELYPKKPAFWHRAYFVASVGGAPLETVRAYVEKQGTTNKPGRRPSKPDAPAGP